MRIESSKVPGAVKRIAHFGSRSYGRLTAPARMLPSFLICGGQRCGTTSLYRALAAHPAVLKAVLHKGVHYFDTGYHRGAGLVPRALPADAHGRPGGAGDTGCRRRRSSPARTTCTTRRRSPGSPATCPKSRCIVLVRDPVERAYSQHAHEVARGFESELSFARALELEPRRLRGQEERLRRDPAYYSFAHQHHAYRARGEYARYLDRLAVLFGRDRIHVVESERFFADPGPVYDEVLAFLGLPASTGHPEFARHNARPRRGAAEPGAARGVDGPLRPVRRAPRRTGWVNPPALAHADDRRHPHLPPLPLVIKGFSRDASGVSRAQPPDHAARSRAGRAARRRGCRGGPRRRGQPGRRRRSPGWPDSCVTWLVARGLGPVAGGRLLHRHRRVHAGRRGGQARRADQPGLLAGPAARPRRAAPARRLPAHRPAARSPSPAW